MSLNLAPVESSTIRAVGHVPSESALYVEFVSGGVYRYDGVSIEDFEKFISAQSMGKHHHQFIKGKFTCTKLEPAAAANAEKKS